MIPLKVRIENFMCYRSAQTITFDGASLWVLCGRNGSGKSTIFDAMTFALYGMSRLADARKGGEELINHHADAMSVEFDFKVRDKLYRIKRTAARDKASTFAALELMNGGRMRHIPGTDREAGLTDWVVTTIGLNKEAFTTSVMLRQGYSDALLSANVTRRSELLKQVVNIKAYEELHGRAKSIKITKERAAEIENALLENLLQRARSFLPEFKNLQDLTPEYLAALEREVEEKQTEVKKIAEALQQLAAYAVQGERWEKLQSDLEILSTKLEKIASLLEKAPEIERNIARLTELSQIVPVLGNILREQQNLAKSEEFLEDCQEQIKQLQRQIEEAENALNAAGREVEKARLEEQNLQQQLFDLAEVREELNQSLTELEKLDAAEREIAKAQTRLAEFPEDLTEQLEQTEALLKEAENVWQVYPWLEQFNKHRANWHTTRKKTEKLEDELKSLQEDKENLEAEKINLTTQLTSLTEEMAKTEKLITELETVKKVVEKSLKNLKGLQGQAKCSQCGQPLTEEHLGREQDGLNQSLEEVYGNLATAQLSYSDAANRKTDLNGQIGTLTSQLSKIDKDIVGKETTIRNNRSQLVELEKEISSCYQQLPLTYQERLNTNGDFTLETGSTFPNEVEMEGFKQTAENYPTRKNHFESLKKLVGDQDKIKATLEPFIRQRNELLLMFPAQPVFALRKAREELDSDISSIKAEFEKLKKKTLPALEKAQSEANETRKKLQSQEQKLELAKVAEDLRHQMTQNTLQNLRSRISETWLITLTEINLKNWQDELEQLKPFEDEQIRLVIAKTEQEKLVERQLELQEELRIIPLEAKCSKEVFEDEQRKLASLQEQTQNRLFELQLRLKNLTEIQCEAISVSSSLANVVEEKKLYVRLEELLGPKNLQQYLLRQAQISIVEYANEILDRISSGNLRLELQGQNNTFALAEKPLDLLVHNFETGAQSISVDKLSGSQKFRVAVSLALGIGKYANQGAQSIGSVIIDEGFGSLDQEGRDEIIEELHRLKNELDKIILVSHQEEFSTRFENVWMTALVDGATQLQRR